MDRLFTRRGVMIGAGSVATAALSPVADVSTAEPIAEAAPAAQRMTGAQVAAHTTRAFLVGTGREAIGVSLEIFASDKLASIDVHPMTHKSFAGCIESNDPAVCAFLMELVERVRLESEQNKPILPTFRPRKRHNGEWITCPACLDHGARDCMTCDGGGYVWRSF